ncbi:hypothetical protein LCGC14_1278070 [marine sediment metagenome]|uniref:Uncharacterized protein n=1 Tax=marine sediment metagenome TaxID=412755 RepID=A0A0F9NCQ5_9ZZZZ
MRWLLLILGLVLTVGWSSTVVVRGIQFDRGAEGYLKRAADANTVELAETQLRIAVDYIEQKNLTEGYTSIIYRTPDEDVGFWYTNLKISLEELHELDSTSTVLERSNMLMKLRETLLDDASDGVSITTPSGISLFPMNTGLAVWGMIGLVMLCVGGVWVLIEGDMY